MILALGSTPQLREAPGSIPGSAHFFGFFALWLHKYLGGMLDFYFAGGLAWLSVEKG
ncbi:hypothetical protein BU24DRAFT_427586 [Aaosphaeria arxii CBS 175.79]|uniref:Uncharacterized protein n=1 Tax=Aaosphaeria arxii CBS 175.79 TaxID=1450172 RepID=A0A6A5XBV7_9PLEO|nr:uncharacterized protein BU24DRAFT_427586 [Aaosphaeria arxii CBS 175.79]KAF2010462.1 hypothetical protein BU24DRAFT_427586 [Aaosphaeria arxii CBS 175.79]